MKTIRSIIIDDEAKSIELLRALLQEYCPQVHLVAVGTDVSSGIQTIRDFDPELVFLDIAMPDGDGFKVLETLEDQPFKVIFTTAYNQHAVKAFNFSALHYLLKPIDIDELIKAVSRFEEEVKVDLFFDQAKLLMDNLKQNGNRLALPHQQGFDIVEESDIIYLSGENNYSWFYLKNDQSVLVSKPLGFYENLLRPSNFFRIHKKHLINLAYVKSFQRGKSGMVTLLNGTELPLSYRRKDEFIRCLKDQVSF